MTIQETLEATLAKTGIPAKRIHCYGSQIVITTLGKESADEWAALVSNFAKVRRVMEALDETVSPNGPHTRDQFHKVWRVFATI